MYRVAALEELSVTIADQANYGGGGGGGIWSRHKNSVLSIVSISPRSAHTALPLAIIM